MVPQMAQASAATQGSGPSPGKKGTKRKAEALEGGGPALSISEQYAKV